ncbi:MAG: DUF6638 family protein [Trueperaceae bacterium]
MSQPPFYADKLIKVSLPALVQRYNDALVSLELPPTKLKTFHVDGMGWSPEVAQEQGNINYLSHTPASSLAIILTPEQRSKPLLSPWTSFDRYVLQRYFASFSKEIADITRSAFLCLELDHTPHHYAAVKDVLDFQAVTVKTSAGSFGRTLSAQAELVRRFLEEDTAWADASLRQEIMASAKTFGDLRTRVVLPKAFTVSDVSSFYTKTFDGIFVLRPNDGDAYLIVRGKGSMPRRKKNTFYLREDEMLSKLLKDNLVVVDDQWYKHQPKMLQQKYDALLAEALFSLEPTLILSNLTPTQRKQRLSLYRNKLPDVLLEFESFMNALVSAKSLRPEDLSAELIILLLHPHHGLPAPEQEVLWQLLCQVQLINVKPFDIAQLYQKDLPAFIKLYQGWPPVKRQWAEAYLRSRKMVS